MTHLERYMRALIARLEAALSPEPCDRYFEGRNDLIDMLVVEIQAELAGLTEE